MRKKTSKHKRKPADTLISLAPATADNNATCYLSD
jgi:hypothetical protein